MYRNRGHVPCEIAERRFERCVRVIADSPGGELACFIELSGNGTLIVSYRALKCAADNALLID